MVKSETLDILTLDLAPPEQFDLRIADVTAPLMADLQEMAFDLAKAQAETRGWQQHAAQQAEQIAALKARVAELTTPTDLSEKRAKAG